MICLSLTTWTIQTRLVVSGWVVPQPKIIGDSGQSSASRKDNPIRVIAICDYYSDRVDNQNGECLWSEVQMRIRTYACRCSNEKIEPPDHRLLYSRHAVALPLDSVTEKCCSHQHSLNSTANENSSNIEYNMTARA